MQSAVEQVSEQAKLILEKVKHHRLFAETKEEKTLLIREMVADTETMMTEVAVLQLSCAGQKDEMVASGVGKKLRHLQGFVTGLLPQIESWLQTGTVATEKLLHPGIPEARSHTKKKPGKKTEFGFKWLVNRLAGGYLFGQMFVGRPSESAMPLEALREYRQMFGEDKTPKIVEYDRGGLVEKECGEAPERRSPRHWSDAKRTGKLVYWGVGAGSGQEFARANGSIDWNLEDGVLQVQQAKTTECENGRAGGPAGLCIQKSEQVDERSNSERKGKQLKEKSRRNEKRERKWTTVKSQERECLSWFCFCSSLSYAAGTNYGAVPI